MRARRPQRLRKPLAGGVQVRQHCRLGGGATGRVAQRHGPLKAAVALLFAAAVIAGSLLVTADVLRHGPGSSEWQWKNVDPGVLALPPWVISAASGMLLRRHHRFAATVALTALILLVAMVVAIGVIAGYPYDDPEDHVEDFLGAIGAIGAIGGAPSRLMVFARLGRELRKRPGHR